MHRECIVRRLHAASGPEALPAGDLDRDRPGLTAAHRLAVVDEEVVREVESTSTLRCYDSSMGGGDNDSALAVRESEFVANATLGDPPHLVVTGSADNEVAPAFVLLVNRLHQAMCASASREITVDTRRLEFMSATAFNAFVNWVVLAADLPPERRYRIRFLSSADHPWQRRSLGSLVGFAPDLVVIEP